ncbi:hypothetical protein RFI_28587, partial [Reticulomyxa filosa]
NVAIQTSNKQIADRIITFTNMQGLKAKKCAIVSWRNSISSMYAKERALHNMNVHLANSFIVTMQFRRVRLCSFKHILLLCVPNFETQINKIKKVLCCDKHFANGDNGQDLFDNFQMRKQVIVYQFREKALLFQQKKSKCLNTFKAFHQWRIVSQAHVLKHLQSLNKKKGLSRFLYTFQIINRMVEQAAKTKAYAKNGFYLA